MMKRIILYLFTLIVTLTSYQAQNENQPDIQTTLGELIQLSKDKLYDKASLLIVYEGGNVNRNLKLPLDPAIKDELDKAKRICKKISALTELSTNFKFGSTTSKNEGTTEIYSIEVSFFSGAQQLKKTFRFIQSQSGFLLKDFD